MVNLKKEAEVSPRAQVYAPKPDNVRRRLVEGLIEFSRRALRSFQVKTEDKVGRGPWQELC